MSRNVINRYSPQGESKVEFADFSIVQQNGNDCVYVPFSSLKSREFMYDSCTMESQRKNNISLGTITPMASRITQESKLIEQVENINNNISNNTPNE